ncbi:phosphoadenosine phosphosulfate reductase family protein [Clostridium brassicae]|uniref:Phosphoadenosine phosphosulfate reductase family protein n=1 Tax=Clostridium brassicae TaxID=2999072 RepID=A0ABT4D958_9CLOT|nr:phosphoadenosine phosphosulfate reductase family protein [Clostridium brassicae]MCY6958844.1 phosphoadenosine phosphosulfate reductase family protein [Clostridium brassicae]
MKEKHIVSFSGGKDSTCLLLKMIEKNMQIDEIIMCDTGMEFPEMYEHVDKVSKMINRKITILKAEKSFEHMMLEHKKRNGKIGYAWPSMMNRWCTSYLKKDVVRRYLRQYEKQSFKVTEYHGIALDEAHRAEKNKEKNVKYPLIEWGLIEKDCLSYCYFKGLNWNGLYKQFKRVSCWCCPLQSLRELKSLYKYHRPLWEQLKDMDKQSWNKFRLDYTLEQLEERFNKEIWWEEHQIKMCI